MPAIPRIEFSNARFSARRRTISALACATSDSRARVRGVEIIRRHSVWIEVIDAIDGEALQSPDMRFLAGIVILLVAGVAFPQSAPEDDPMRGPANTYQKYEIRPGITLGVQYESDGLACHMDITPLYRPRSDSWPIDTIPLDTINSILDEVLPAKVYGKRVGVFTSYMSCASMAYLRANGVGIKITECPLPRPEVEEVAIQFTRPECPPQLGAIPF
jgi:hypothetical protein